MFFIAIARYIGVIRGSGRPPNSPPQRSPMTIWYCRGTNLSTPPGPDWIEMSALAKVLRPLDPNDSQPLYQQVQRVLRDAIDKRILSPDDALPAERELATGLAVSRITIRKAIDGLVKEGLLVNKPGSGNFVSARIEKNFAKLSSFSEDMKSRGRTPHS